MVAQICTQVDYGSMLERNPGLLGSHSNDFSVYTERVTALVQWAPPTLDLNKVPGLFRLE